MTKHDIARLGREEHEDRESRRKAKKRLRGFKTKHPQPRSIRDRRTAGKHENFRTPGEIVEQKPEIV